MVIPKIKATNKRVFGTCIGRNLSVLRLSLNIIRGGCGDVNRVKFKILKLDFFIV